MEVWRNTTERKESSFNGLNGPLPKMAVIMEIVHMEDVWLRNYLPGSGSHIWSQVRGNHFRAKNLTLDSEGSKFILESPLGNSVVVSPLIGRYNVSNVLASFAIMHAMGEDVLKSIQKLRKFHGVSGRMELVDKGQPYRVVVDYAHTLMPCNALEMLQECTKGKVGVVFWMRRRPEDEEKD